MLLLFIAIFLHSTSEALLLVQGDPCMSIALSELGCNQSWAYRVNWQDDIKLFNLTRETHLIETCDALRLSSHCRS